MKTNQLKRAIFPLVIAVLVTMVGGLVSGAPPDEKKITEKSTGDALGESKDERSASTNSAKKKKVDNDLDRQLLRDLVPDLPIDPETPEEASDDAKTSSNQPQSRLPFADELDETVAAMREVSLRLDKLNLSDDTEQLQTGIVSNIDKLIEKLKNLPPPSSSSSSENSDSDQSDSDSQSQGQKKEPQPKPQPSSEKQNGADSDTGATSKLRAGKSAESTEQNRREARERAAALARRRAMIDEVWGHLPPAMRERLLNVGSEKLLPKYEDLIRRYYEALAEPDRRGARR